MIATPPTPLDQFRAAVMADAEIQAELAGLLDPIIFEARAVACAAAKGIVLSATDLANIWRPASIGLQRPGSAQVPPPSWPPRGWLAEGLPGPGWLPVGLTHLPEPGIHWLHFAEVSPNSPFFEDAVHQVVSRPFNRLFHASTPIANLHHRTAVQAPSGFIFHMSRCGSTLVSQMLGAMPGVVSISEAPPIDTLIQQHFADPELHAEALRGLVHAYRRGAEHLFVKLDSWHTRALPLLRRTFPDTPWIFLYRDPVEVLVSHQRQRGMHTVPGLVPPASLGLVPEDAQLPEHAFIARVLERICSAVVEHHPDGLLVNYAELPEALFSRVLPHFAIAPDTAMRMAMEAVAGRHSKRPEAPFQADSEAKRREANTDLRTSAEQYLAPVFAALEARRLSASPR